MLYFLLDLFNSENVIVISQLHIKHINGKSVFVAMFVNSAVNKLCLQYITLSCNNYNRKTKDVDTERERITMLWNAAPLNELRT